MIVTSNLASKADWNILRCRLTGLKYSRDASGLATKFSLDEPLDFFRTTDMGDVSAASLIHVIGHEDFKKFINFVWEAKPLGLFPEETVKISAFFYFISRRYLYGRENYDNFHYWDALESKIRLAEHNNLI